MSQILAYRVQLHTQPADENGVLLFLRGRLLACVVYLADVCYDELTGHWFIETAYGFAARELPETFSTLREAVAAITKLVTGTPMEVQGEIADLLKSQAG